MWIIPLFQCCIDGRWATGNRGLAGHMRVKQLLAKWYLRRIVYQVKRFYIDVECGSKLMYGWELK